MMKTLNYITLFVLSIVLVSCGDKKATSNDPIEKGKKNAMEVFSNLDEIEKEIKGEEEKRANHILKGYVKVTLDGKTQQFSSWSNANSRGSLFNNKANFLFSIDEENKETISFIFNAKDLYDGNIKTDYCATRYPYKMMDTDFMEKFGKAFAGLSYSNDATEEEWNSGDGEVIIESLSENTLKARWKGEALLGDWREKNLVPFEAEVNLSFNFISDLRNLK